MEIHLQLLEDLGPTCLCSTASMALLLAEEVHKRDMRQRIKLKKVIFGAETHTDKMRRRFESWLGIEESFDITRHDRTLRPGGGPGVFGPTTASTTGPICLSWKFSIR